MREEATKDAKKESEGERLHLQNQIEEIKRKSQEEIEEVRAQNKELNIMLNE